MAVRYARWRPRFRVRLQFAAPGSGDNYTGERKVTYPDGSVWHAVDIFTFREGKLLRQVAYFGTALEAPDWRARWREPNK